MLVEKTLIRLNKIRIYAYHGVMEQERVVGGWYLLTIEADYPFESALDSDDVADTLNYAEMLSVAQEEMKKPSRLLEHVAGRIGRALFDRFPRLRSVNIELTKENPPMGGNTQGASVLLCLKNDKN